MFTRCILLTFLFLEIGYIITKLYTFNSNLTTVKQCIKGGKKWCINIHSLLPFCPKGKTTVDLLLFSPNIILLNGISDGVNLRDRKGGRIYTENERMTGRPEKNRFPRRTERGQRDRNSLGWFSVRSCHSIKELLKVMCNLEKSRN